MWRHMYVPGRHMYVPGRHMYVPKGPLPRDAAVMINPR